MLTTTAERIISGLRGGDGRPFTIFVDRLLRAYGYVLGVADIGIITTVRTNLPDGGVDTEVRSSFPGDATGLLGTATVWQYKATAFTDVRRGDLLAGEYVKARVAAGDAFRLALADSMPADRIKAWETALLTEAQQLNPDAPRPLIVTADRLAELANRFPGLVLATFFAEARNDLMHLEAWGPTARDATAVYVPVPAWAGVQQSLAKHVDFTTKPPSAVRTVQGEAGVGKSRLVFETVQALHGAEGLVIYTMEGRAVDVALSVINDAQARAVIVADECDVDTRLRLAKLLDGHAERVRVIAIDNTLIRPETPDPELALGKMPEATLAEVLESNFPAVDPARRRAYVDLAEGFPRLAADLCRWDPVITQQGNVGPVIPRIGEYYRVRLKNEQREAVAALSLVTKIGYSGEVADELELLCQFLGLSRVSMHRALDAVQQGPGFVARSGRYMHVTPELIAQVAFDDGWRRFADRNPARFLADFPPSLLDAFLDRVWRSGAEEVRRECAAFFREWAVGRGPADLTDVAAVHRLVSLVDTDPTDYLPVLRRLVERATVEELRAVTGASTGFGGWGPRRALVWLAERFAQLPEYWDDAERLLAAMAGAESEPDIANNATAIWGQSFRIVLSGTATPFDERLGRLRERLRDDRPGVRAAARSVLRAPLAGYATRMASSAVVAGRIPPPEWTPRTHGEAHTCIEGALSFLADAVTWDGETRTAVLEATLDELRHLIAIGHLAPVRRIFETVALTDDERVRLIDALDLVLEYDVRHSPGPSPAHAGGEEGSPGADDAERRRAIKHADEVAAWRAAVVGTDLHSRVLALAGKERWRSVRLRHEAEWQASLVSLAQDLAEDSEALAQEVPWLTSPAARAAAELGEALAKIDQEAALFDLIMASAATGEAGLLARGYAKGLVSAHRDRLEAWLDAREADAPVIAADVAITAGESANALERVLRLFDTGKLPSHYLYSRNFPADKSGELSPADLESLLDRLAAAAEAGDEVALRVGLDNLSFRLPYEVPASPDATLEAHPHLVALGWRLLEAVSDDAFPPSHWWDSLVVHLGRFDASRGARYCARLLRAQSIAQTGALVRAIGELARIHPYAMMEAVGEVMLDDTAGYRFFIGDYQALFEAIPDEIKREWLERVGVDGARRIARHLVAPYVTEDGQAVVPSFTEWVLERFQDDERTCSEFWAGTRSWKMYSGDIAAEHEAEAEAARRFLDHPLRPVRQWAAQEESTARAEARAARQRAAEQDLF